MIKIVRKKTWEKMLEDLTGLSQQVIHMQEILKGEHNRYVYETGARDDRISELEKTVEELEKRLRKAEHDKSVAFKMLKKLQHGCSIADERPAADATGVGV